MTFLSTDPHIPSMKPETHAPADTCNLSFSKWWMRAEEPPMMSSSSLRCFSLHENEFPGKYRGPHLFHRPLSGMTGVHERCGPDVLWDGCLCPRLQPLTVLWAVRYTTLFGNRLILLTIALQARRTRVSVRTVTAIFKLWGRSTRSLRCRLLL